VIETAQIVAAARRTTGLHDLGNGDFFPGVEVQRRYRE